MPKGRLPWTVDNKRVDSPLGKGWKTLLEAIEAAEGVDMDAAIVPTQRTQSAIRHNLLDLRGDLKNVRLSTSRIHAALYRKFYL